ncbi:MAG TPA: SDR family oxidoreductase [Candidatus Acidoferrales bacterium]|jgi:NAD(P)-dependent dehydrogenase (short-subunit alcohol dehydrogenase family)|nr:SDR family oxidoreductase [Candidatus Acidoferrales bacterium]
MSVVPDSPQSARVLVTGGSRGIGLEVARDLAAAGHRLWLAATTEKVREAAAQLGHLHRASPVDVADPNSVASLFAEIHRDWEGLDAVIHSAAELGQTGNFWQLDPEKFAHTLRVNSAGPFFIAKAFVQTWLDTAPKTPSRRGKIILFAGGGAGYGYPQFLPYGTSKAAAVRMCETMSMELDAAQIPIDVNIIAPGANETSMLAAVRAAGGEVRTVVPFSKPIALCRWLLSSESDGVSGRFLHVNDPYPTLSPSSLRAEALKLRRIDL